MKKSGSPNKRSSRWTELLRRLRLRRVSQWSLLAGAVAFAMMFGLGIGVIVVLVGVAAYKGIELAFGQRISERFERQPDLVLKIARDGRLVDRITSHVLPPWPLDSEAIVAYEVSRLLDDAERLDAQIQKTPRAFLGFDPFAVQPRPEDHQRARDKFAEHVADYEQELRSWLVGYGDAADERAQTIELSLFVVSAASGAYAEDVILVLDLPEGVKVAEQWPTVSPPPEEPHYVPPRPRSPSGDLGRWSESLAGIMPTPLAIRQMPLPARLSKWQVRNSGRTIERTIGNVHHDAILDLDEPLLLMLPTSGTFEVAWTLRARNGRRHCAGTLTLEVPVPPERPAFKRLEGVRRYPDVPFVDDDGATVLGPRTTDPPTEPPSASTSEDIADRIGASVARRDWLALGFEIADGVDDIESEESR